MKKPQIAVALVAEAWARDSAELFELGENPRIPGAGSTIPEETNPGDAGPSCERKGGMSSEWRVIRPVTGDGPEP